MSDKPFWHAESLSDGKFSYTPPASACVGPIDYQFFMGGVAMATHVEALERHFGRPLYWATTHFLNHGLLGEEMHLTIEAVSGGRSVVQAVAEMKRDNIVLHRTIAALGARDGEPDKTFVRMPDVPAPEKCPGKQDDLMASDGNLMSLLERKTALEDSAAGLEYMWIRPLFDTKVDAPYLALISDFFLGAHERTRRGTSLDNTFRLINLVESEWLMMMTQVSSFTRGAAHGTTHIFAQDGTLLATSSQTGLLPRPLE